jgi:hypothetical protein
MRGLAVDKIFVMRLAAMDCDNIRPRINDPRNERSQRLERLPLLLMVLVPIIGPAHSANHMTKAAFGMVARDASLAHQ